MLKNIAKQIDIISRKVLIMEIDKMSDCLAPKLVFFLILAISIEHTER